LAAGVFNSCFDTCVDGGSAGETVIRVTSSLPAHAPATGLLTNVVSTVTGNQYRLLWVDGQHTIVVFQQHQALAHGLTGNGAMLRVTDHVLLPGQRALRWFFIKQTGPHFHAQNPAYCIIQTRFADLA